MDIYQPWTDYTYVALDTETSGALPLESEICEIAAVKWKNGKIIDEYQSLVKVTKKMSDFIIGIHGITNEMVADAPKIQDLIPGFLEFIKGSVLLGHHIPFDMAFIALELEKLNIPLPDNSVVCTSLLSRAMILDSPNHKLQTLIPHLGIHQGTAHRALDDSKACLEVFLHCMKKEKHPMYLNQVIDKQGTAIPWKDFSYKALDENQNTRILVSAIKEKQLVEIEYATHRREIFPKGLVLSPGNNFVQALCMSDNSSKRFYLNKITSVKKLGPYYF